MHKSISFLRFASIAIVLNTFIVVSCKCKSTITIHSACVNKTRKLP